MRSYGTLFLFTTFATHQPFRWNEKKCNADDSCSYRFMVLLQYHSDPTIFPTRIVSSLPVYSGVPRDRCSYLQLSLPISRFDGTEPNAIQKISAAIASMALQLYHLDPKQSSPHVL